jgi:TRAP-type C4-dicarboxylate transport system substrate-binding protein
MRINKLSVGLTAALAALVATSALAQTKWDMPTPYSDGTFHTKNARQFAEEVAKGGKLQISVHSNASLIKHPEIKRAVQTGQVPIGEILISVLANESPLFAFDSNPFLANGYEKEKKLWAAAKPYLEKRLDAQGIRRSCGRRPSPISRSASTRRASASSIPCPGRRRRCGARRRSSRSPT